MNDRAFFTLASERSEGYLEPGDVADRLMWETLKKEFEKDLRRLERSGDEEALKGYVEAIIEGLEETDGILVEYSPDTADVMISMLREYLKKGKVSTLFSDVERVMN